MALMYSIVKHGVAESTNLIATNYGAHTYSVRLTTDLDNGSLVNVSDMKYISTANNQGLRTQVAPIATCRVGLVLQDPLIYEEFTKEFQNEEAFYNKAGSDVRVYDLVEHDVFTVNAAAITALAEAPVKDNYVIAKTDYTIEEVATAPKFYEVGFVGKIVDTVKRSNGVFYKIEVLQNRAIYTAPVVTQ